MDDFYSVASFGLIHAAKRFDPKKNIKFKTFAEQRIKGSVLDHFRKENKQSRGQYVKFKTLLNQIDLLEHERKESLSQEEVCEALSISRQDLSDCLIQNQFLMEQSDDDNTYVTDNALEKLETQHYLNKLEKAIDSLTKLEKTTLILYYHEEFSQKDIGFVLGYSESRVCQIIKRAISKLQDTLEVACMKRDSSI